MALITIVVHDKPGGGAAVTMHAEPRPVEGAEAKTDAEKLALIGLNAIAQAVDDMNKAPRLLVVEGDGTIKRH